MVSSHSLILSQLPLPSPTQSLNLSWNRSGSLLHRKTHLRKSVPHVTAMQHPEAREMLLPSAMQLPAASTLTSQLNTSLSSDMT